MSLQSLINNRNNKVKKIHAFINHINIVIVLIIMDILFYFLSIYLKMDCVSKFYAIFWSYFLN